MEYPKEIQEKLNHLRSYVPFVQRMISKLEVRSQQVGASHGQLERLHGLHGFLTNPIPRAPRMEMLEKMEAVIRSMQDKVHRAQGKTQEPPGAQRPGTHMDVSRSSGSVGSGAAVPRFSQDPGHLRTGSSSSDPKTFGKHTMGSIWDMASGNGGTSSGNTSSGQTPSPARAPHQSSTARSEALDWQSRKDFSGKEEKRRDGQSERSRERPEFSRESSYDQSRREADRNDGRSMQRSVERGSDRNREREYERSRTKEHEHRRDIDSQRLQKRESLDRDARVRVSAENEYERRQDISRDRESERDKNRAEFARRSSSQEKSVFVNDRDYRRQDSSSGDKGRKMEGQTMREQEKKHSDVKSSKWGSLLDLPMPPPSQDSASSSDEKFQNSREKLQRLFGIFGESSGSKEKEKEISPSKHRGWREEARARKDNFSSQRSSQGSGDIDKRVDLTSLRQKIQQQRESGTSHHHSVPKSLPTQGNELREHFDVRKSGSSSRSTRSSTEYPSNAYPVRDTPLSPDQSPDDQFDCGDTPMSPDMEGTFSPSVPSTEENSPVKTIPLENVQQKGVDLDAIKKALSRIQESDKQSDTDTAANQGPSYRFEDFVGPASKSKPNEEEPYDPEEVWNDQNASSSSGKTTLPARPASRDADLRSLPKAVTSQPLRHHGKMGDKRADIPGSTSHSKTDFQGHTSASSRSGAPGSTSCQRRPSFESQRTSNQSSSGTTASPWHPSASGSRPSNSNSSDVDMRLQQSQSSLSRPKLTQPKPQEPSARMLHSPPGQSPTAQSSHPSSASLPHRSLNRPPEESSEGKTHILPLNRLESVRSRIAHKTNELIKPGQQGVAASQMEKYKLKKQSSTKPEGKPQSSPSTSTKLDGGIKSKEPVSVLDLLLPESKEEKSEECLSTRDPRQHSHIQRDPRLKQSEPDTSTGPPHARDPRLSASSSFPRDPRHQGTNRDPRQDASKHSSLHGDNDSRLYGPSGSQVRDPRKDPSSARGMKDTRNEGPQFPMITSNQSRDPRDLKADQRDLRADQRDPRADPRNPRGDQRDPIADPRDKRADQRDPRSDPRDPRADPRDPRADLRVPRADPRDPRADLRDPRASVRGDRPPHVWPHLPPTAPTSNYSVQAPAVTPDPPPTLSASGSLIGQSFTCLMMRGLPHFTNSNHIYFFFQEYMLRDISIELDNHFRCKGTAYVHFPSHSSAREALEQLNGCSLRGFPISLRICAVGILRQAKNAYEDLNREKESRMGIPERPRGNCNPFFKPRPREPPSKPPSHPTTTPTEKVDSKPEAAVSQKSPAIKSSFKIPKIKKDESNEKDCSKSDTVPKKKDDAKSEVQEIKTTKSSKSDTEPKKKEDAKSEVQEIKTTKSSKSYTEPKKKDDAKSEVREIKTTKSSKSYTEPKKKDDAKSEVQEIKTTKSSTTKPSKDSSESGDDSQDKKVKNAKPRKFKKIVILSDSESSSDDEPKAEESKDKKEPNQVSTNKERKETQNKYVGGNATIAKSKDVDDKDFSAFDDVSDDDSADDDDFMVIDESIQLSETEESEVSSQVSEEPPDFKEFQKEPKTTKTKGKSKGKQKPAKKTAPAKGKKKLQDHSASGKKIGRKKSIDKYLLDDAYKPDQPISALGLKLTRHAQEELEVLITEEKKLKVLLPVPLKIVRTICEDVKFMKGGRAKAAKPVEKPIDTEEAPIVTEVEETKEVLPVEEIKKPCLEKKPDMPDVILPVDNYWEYSAKYGSFGAVVEPENTKFVVALRKEVALNTPTARRGKKRKKSSKGEKVSSKKQKCIPNSMINQQSYPNDLGKSEVQGIPSEGANEPCRVAEKRSSLSPPQEENDVKRLCLEKDKDTAKSEGTSHFDLFESSMLSDDPDLTHITPSLFDVDPAISIALPNVSALASMLSPPHLSLSSSESKIGDSIWSTVKHLSDEEKNQLESVSVKDLADSVMEEDSVLEEMINIAIKTASIEENESTVTEYEDPVKEDLKRGTMGTETSESREGEKQAEIIMDEDIKRVNDIKSFLEGSTEEPVNNLSSCINDESFKAPETSDLPAQLPSTSDKEHLLDKDVPCDKEHSTLDVDKEHLLNTEPSCDKEHSTLDSDKEHLLNTEPSCDKEHSALDVEHKQHLLDTEASCDKEHSTLDAEHKEHLLDREVSCDKENSTLDAKHKEHSLATEASCDKEYSTLDAGHKKHLLDTEVSCDKEHSTLNADKEHLLNTEASCDKERSTLGARHKEHLLDTEVSCDKENSTLDADKEHSLATEASCDKEHSTLDADKEHLLKTEPSCDKELSILNAGHKEHLLDTEASCDKELSTLDAEDKGDKATKVLSDMPVEQPSSEVAEQADKEASDEVPHSPAEDTLPSVEKSEKQQSSDSTLKISEEETMPKKSESSEKEAATNLKKDEGIGAVTQEDTDDDVASSGRISTNSFIDDASIVSSEGRDVRTPECPPTKKAKKSKNQGGLASVECRRVTRGSVMEPLTAEQVEWDDGGVVDLFQCDQCDYVGRHMAHHLVNFHMEREMPCEFKKEDFPPVMKDYVGPPQEDTDGVESIDLSWIPNNMNFDEIVTCKECDYFSKNRFDLIYHYLEHVPKARNSVYHCRLCNYMCEKMESFYNHVSSHTGEYRFRCELCGHLTYKKELLQSHHIDSHKTQSKSFSEAPMIEDNGWFYIYICKVCMFVRISSEEAEKHVQQKHGGKADIYKANMSRPVILHSESRKYPAESESTVASRPKSKGKKKKKGKKLPDLEVFVGEEEGDVKEVEEKAQQLVERISSNIHTTVSVEDSKKRMSLLNSISMKLDEKTDEDTAKQESCPDNIPESESKSESKEEPSAEQDSKHTEAQPTVDDVASSQIPEKQSSIPGIQGEVSKDDQTKEKESSNEESQNESDGGVNGLFNRLSDLENRTTESDSESTISVVDPRSLDEDMLAGPGFLQDTIRKLSAQLVKNVSEKEASELSDEESTDTAIGEVKKSLDKGAVNSEHDNDSDSDMLVICEDEESDKEEETEKPDQSKDNHSTKQSTSDGDTSPKPSLQDSIQSILREASAQREDQHPMPKVRVRPAHQLFSPEELPDDTPTSVPIGVLFKCCVSGCYYNSSDQSDLIEHIIQKHGPYKCIASGCQFVTKSRDLYHFHLITLHPKLKYLVCPFHCKKTLKNYVQLIDHLTAHHSGGMHKDKSQEQPEDVSDADNPGFLKIESVSTMDPAAASKMFGDDYSAASRDAVPLPVSLSPTKPPGFAHSKGLAMSTPQKIVISSGSQGTTLGSLPKGSLGSPQGSTVTVTTPEGKTIRTSQGITINIPQTVTKSPDASCSSMFSSVVSPTSMERIVTLTSKTSGQSVPPGHQSAGSFITLSSLPRSTTTMNVTVEDSLAVKNLKKTFEGLGSSESSGQGKVWKPSCVVLDGDGNEEKDSLPPGMATLPKTPPTVPIQLMFQLYQSADVFKTLITKLAPEVFKCMYPGCVFAEDDSETFISHISKHGSDYRCCYCLVLMASPEYLVQHIIREHSHCEFQCKYCLYRALTKIYMGVHLKNFHPHEEPRYIKVETIQPRPPPNPSIDQFVRPYKCTHQDCQYRTVDAEAFKSHVNGHGRFVILKCDFCHKYLHVIPLINHMREHQMNEYQCPYCLHGDAEKERLLSHLLNCHSGRPGKVLLRKQITSVITTAAAASGTMSPPSKVPVPSSSAGSDSDSRSEGLNTSKDLESPDKHKEEAKLALQIKPLHGRRASRSSSTEQEGPKDNDVVDDSLLMGVEKTGLSGHALNRCGNEGCEYSSLSQIKLREHLLTCDLAQDSTILRCYHCGKQCRHLSTLLDHLRVHGPKRYYCGVTGCDYRATMAHYFKNHMKQIHKCTGFKQLIKDRSKDLENQEYMVYPKDAMPVKEGHRKRKNEYGIDDIYRIPRAHVSYQELKCYHCSFVSKVRLNLIKHIKLHEKFPEGIPLRVQDSGGSSCSIPSLQPVNPVPCLERKELMFDKMMNLAGSSFENSKRKEESDFKTKNPIPPEEYQTFPKYVPEEKLYTCGIVGCNYVSCDDMMLKYHIRSLHADAMNFPCPHCTDASITVEKMSAHFKLHGERLYRCGWCPYISSRRNIIDRHLKEKHSSKKPFDYVIRQPEDPEAPKKPEEKPVEEPVAATPPPSQDQQWQCGMCKFTCAKQHEMLNHTSLKHASKSQFKCGYCNVRSSVRASFDGHIASKHPNQPFRVLCLYYRLDSDDVEPLDQGNMQNMHEPIWKRNDPDRIRHIRGILIDDDTEVKKNLFKHTSKGKPEKGEFVCPKCGSFKTSNVSTFRSHLCREASYARYQCSECGITNALLPSLQRHYNKIHKAPFTPASYLLLPIEEEKEEWVESVISYQEDLIRKWYEKDSSESGSESLPGKSGTSSRRPSGSSSSHSLPGETGEEQSGIVLRDSGSDRGRYVCDVCGSECRTAGGLKSHKTALHQTRFKCHYCPFASNSEDAVKQHTSAKHPKLQSVVLEVSQKGRAQRRDSGASDDSTSPEKRRDNQGQEGSASTMSSSWNYIEQSEDQDDMSFENDLLDPLADTEQSSLVKIYSCKFCSFTTTTTSRLNNHNRSKHTDTRLYMCMYCNARFNSTKDALVHHKWKHLPDKPDIGRVFNNKGENVKKQAEARLSDNTEVASPPKSNVMPVRAKARKSFPRSSSVTHIKSPVSGASDTSATEPTYTCCHCSHKSSKIGMEGHIKKEHRDLPYQVRREENDRVFTEVHVYKCIHCVIENISLAQAMDHWLQNHPLFDFKFDLVLRHSGEVSNQVVSSTTADRDLPDEKVDADDDGLDAEGLNIPGIERGAISSSAIPSCSDITSSSEASSSHSGKLKKYRASTKDTSSSAAGATAGSSVDDDGDDLIDLAEVPEMEPSQGTDKTDMVYKCGLCKKSSNKLHDIHAHIRKVHPDRDVTIRRMSQKVFEQLFRSEYQCSYCKEKGRHRALSNHHKTVHPGLPMKVSRISQPSANKGNVYFRCDVCGHVVKNLSSVRQHIRRQHPNANDLTFTKLTLGSPMMPPLKQPFKCNYCGDVGETLEEMHTHHAFLHSHLECSITNLMDEALSSLHSPSTSHSVEGSKISSSVYRSVSSKSPAVSSAISEVGNLDYTSESAVPDALQCKNTARKSFPLSKRAVAMKSTSKPQVTEEQEGGDEEFTSYRIAPSPLELEDVFAFVNLGGGVPVKLTVQQLSQLVDMEPQVLVSDISDTAEH